MADIAAGRMRFAERVRRIGGGLAAAAEGDLDIVLDDWTMRRAPDGTLTLAAGDRDAEIGLRLALVPQQPLVLQGDAGLSRKGPGVGNASVYVSYPRMAANGTLEVGGRTLAVHGEAWFDHEWGTSQLGPGVVGWDWLGLRLADGRDLMLYRLRLADGRAARSRPARSSRATAPRAAWRPATLRSCPSPGGRAPAPARATRRASASPCHPPASISRCAPELADAELDARRSTGTIYWEGPVAVTGTVLGESWPSSPVTRPRSPAGSDPPLGGARRPTQRVEPQDRRLSPISVIARRPERSEGHRSNVGRARVRPQPSPGLGIASPRRRRGSQWHNCVARPRSSPRPRERRLRLPSVASARRGRGLQGQEFREGDGEPGSANDHDEPGRPRRWRPGATRTR